MPTDHTYERPKDLLPLYQLQGLAESSFIRVANQILRGQIALISPRLLSQNKKLEIELGL